jgi:hypothetical protein
MSSPPLTKEDTMTTWDRARIDSQLTITSKAKAIVAGDWGGLLDEIQRMILTAQAEVWQEVKNDCDVILATSPVRRV